MSTSNTQDPDHAEDRPPGASPAEDWTKLLFTRANPHAELQAAQALAHAAHRTLRVSLALAKSGRAIDLTGLDRWFGRLTASALDLEPHEGRQLRPALLALLDCLNQLEHTVTSRAPPPGTT